MNFDCRPLLEEILNRLQRIEEVLHLRRCTPADLEALSKLLPAIGGQFGSSMITVREILADPGIAGLKLGSQQVIGNLLSRAADDGANVAGLQVQRAGREHNATLWQITRGLPGPIER